MAWSPAPDPLRFRQFSIAKHSCCCRVMFIQAGTEGIVHSNPMPSASWPSAPLAHRNPRLLNAPIQKLGRSP